MAFMSSRIIAKRLAVGALAVFLAGCSSAASSSPSASQAVASSSAEASASASATAALELVAAGALTYGTAATFPPFEFKGADGALTGFDIEMIGELAKTMGLTPTPLDVNFDGLIPALQGTRIDIINSAMYINPAREAQVDFIPYMVIGETILVPKGNPKKVTSVPEGLSGLTVAVTRGAIGETYMTKFNQDLKAAGKPEMTILALPTNQDALLAVTSGRADAFDTSTPGAAYTLAALGDKLELAVTFDLGTKIGIAVRKGDTAMADALKAALNTWVASGGYEKLLAKYNLPPEVNFFKQ